MKSGIWEVTQKVKHRSPHQTQESLESLESSVNRQSLDEMQAQRYFDGLEAS